MLVNNAGVIRDNMLFKMTLDDWDTVLGIHLRGSFLMSKACQKYMVDRQFGRIVNLSSSSALGNRGQANYSAAKAGLQGFTKTLAIELGQFGITANAVAPGFIATDMTAATAARIGIGFEEFQKAAAASIPVRRVGTPGRRRARDLVPGQRRRGLRVRPGHLRGRRPPVLTEVNGANGAASTPPTARAGGRVPGQPRPARATEPLEFLRARFDAGLAWVHYPAGTGRPGTAPFPAVRSWIVSSRRPARPSNHPERNGIGLGMAAPTILAHGTRGAEAALAAAAVDGRGDLVPAVQ